MLEKNQQAQNLVSSSRDLSRPVKACLGRCIVQTVENLARLPKSWQFGWKKVLTVEKKIVFKNVSSFLEYWPWSESIPKGFFVGASKPRVLKKCTIFVPEVGLRLYFSDWNLKLTNKIYLSVSLSYVFSDNFLQNYNLHGKRSVGPTRFQASISEGRKCRNVVDLFSVDLRNQRRNDGWKRLSKRRRQFCRSRCWKTDPAGSDCRSICSTTLVDISLVLQLEQKRQQIGRRLHARSSKIKGQ